ncbi:hypothetical protein LTR99_007773 [Exophiala xenobiotica]|uniref:Zn(2)-C6 fungal-type domain-containing protein n=1 Tax=Vermiconidia calcicola TaxID=1690605 RepID=A0AAV9Q6Z2_9PEZI|nr:hypothetical protein LTR92_001304 [Exophiala xenobiotica]KAK5535256.1 hypothetical protein LTR25_006264 [Vermiconidia calcicola]KAK5546757.1 hypothetical protein LTR23_003128 [Chaetothyriales sp. CCFEE 6169]KAK5298084.1 hypothetical protein LTR99_007773 [Exophiala xenobiotica]KAK5429013.1 hypothetical protein LTR34_007472 [Exophiala xenobiotica]
MSTIDSSTTSANASKGRSKPPSLLACIPCRRSHLKCSGEKPLCKRCADRNSDCYWVESRRGYREFRKTQSATDDNGSETPTRNDAIFNESQPPHLQPSFQGVDEADPSEIRSLTYDELFPPGIDPTFTSMPLELQTIYHGPSSPGGQSDSTMSIPREPSSTGPKRGGDDLIDLFYKHFHPGHPFIIPRKTYLDNPLALPKPLRAVIHYLASHYVPGTNQNALETVARGIFSDDVPDDGYKVQGLLLYAMTCFARFGQEEGAKALEQAVDIALRIGMNRQSFAIQHGRNDPTIQESWRRTWWSLFIVEATIVVIGGQSQPFRLYTTFTDVPLPGDDEDYNDARSSPLPRSLTDLQNRTFSEDTYAYSSFAYAIEAAYILGSVLALGPDTFAVTDPQVEAIDASITNYFLSLPPTKREVIGQCGHVDENLLVAHLLINWAAISLHRPRSSLTFIRNHYRTTCTRAEAAGLPALAYSSHTAKALRAANNVINLATVQHSMIDAPPVLMCGITTAATVHLPAYSMIDRPDQAIAIKERLQVAVSALAAFAEIWPRASIAKGQVAKFAREVLTKPNVCVDSTGPGMIPRIAPEPMPQLQYDMPPFNNELWMENLIETEPNVGDGPGCAVFDNFTMPQLQDTVTTNMSALETTTTTTMSALQSTA